MQRRPLLISSLLDYAERYRPHGAMVSRMLDGSIDHGSWGAVARGSRHLAGALRRLGVQPGERVARLAWNHHRHLKLFFGISGTSVGEIHIRGPCVLSGYFKGVGDVGTMDPKGFLGITGRAKDVVKARGEWINSIELENPAVSYPAVREAAMIAARHPRWQQHHCCWCSARTARASRRPR